MISWRIWERAWGHVIVWRPSWRHVSAGWRYESHWTEAQIDVHLVVAHLTIWWRR